MPHGLRRFQQAESLYFLTFSCFHRLPFLSEPAAKPVVVTTLEQIRSRHEARVYAYVVMPEHVHVLLNEPPHIPLDQFIKAWKQAVSRQLKGERDQFWQSRYYDRNIRGSEALYEVIRYIHRNPVKRGLVTKPEDYEWSSFTHYLTGTRGPVEIESEWTAMVRDRARISRGG